MDYLSELQKRQKWKKKSSNILQVGQIVFLKDDSQPPLKWHQYLDMFQLYVQASTFRRVKLHSIMGIKIKMKHIHCENTIFREIEYDIIVLTQT